ncbi:hypothetical protein Baya_0920 [Bagarius yarrelli]|uniref:Uncharacterized protein n=1 Tax=Bagarius yarrelli TaxID=175774 RepID=A0A556TJM2_BAGYA|nr:hypothetical protein Baya_0920 [Bagarius yarrelli]
MEAEGSSCLYSKDWQAKRPVPGTARATAWVRDVYSAATSSCKRFYAQNHVPYFNQEPKSTPKLEPKPGPFLDEFLLSSCPLTLDIYDGSKPFLYVVHHLEELLNGGPGLLVQFLPQRLHSSSKVNKWAGNYQSCEYRKQVHHSTRYLGYSPQLQISKQTLKPVTKTSDRSSAS